MKGKDAMEFKPHTHEQQMTCTHPIEKVYATANVKFIRTFGMHPLINCEGSITVICQDCKLAYSIPVAQVDYDMAAAMDRAAEMFRQFSDAQKG